MTRWLLLPALLALSACSLPMRTAAAPAAEEVLGPPAVFSLRLPLLKVYGRPRIHAETDDLESCQRFQKLIVKELAEGYLQHSATECVERAKPLP